MNIDFSHIAPYLKDPMVLFGFFLFLFFLFARKMLKLGSFPDLPKDAYNLLSLILPYGYIIGLLLVSLGFALKYREVQTIASIGSGVRDALKDAGMSEEDKADIARRVVEGYRNGTLSREKAVSQIKVIRETAQQKTIASIGSGVRDALKDAGMSEEYQDDISRRVVEGYRDGTLSREQAASLITYIREAAESGHTQITLSSKLEVIVNPTPMATATPTPEPTPRATATPASPLNEDTLIAEARKKFDLGQIAFRPSAQMELHRTETFEARIARREQKTEILIEGLRGQGYVEIKTLKIRCKMKITLVADKDTFKISPILGEKEEARVIDFQEDYASWKWEVTPLKPGAHEIHLVAEAIADIKSLGEKSLYIRTFDRQINVKVTKISVLDWAARNLQYIIGTLILPALGALWAFYIKWRDAKSKDRKPPDPPRIIVP
jgi:hypothetical protein